MPAALAGADVIGLAPTGTGKTLGYVLPVAHQLLESPPPIVRGTKGRSGGKRPRRVDPRTRLRAVVLCPTRELAQQVAKDALAVTKGSLLRVGAVWGKSALAPQREQISRGLDLLVGTPGRVRELLDLDALSLAHVRHVVIDECDRMLDLGFLPQVEAILDRMPPERQVLLLSATLPPAVATLAASVMREPTRVEVGGHSRPAVHVRQALYRVDEVAKMALVLALIAGERRSGVIVFVRTRRRAGWVAQALRAHGVITALLHGDRSQAQREKALDDFAAGRAVALVATDVAARGLHIPATRAVINYDVPLLPEEYVHRVGRAGHGGGSAESLTLLASDPAEEARWSRVASLARLDLRPTPAPDLTPWMRAKDRPRVERPNARRASDVREPDPPGPPERPRRKPETRKKSTKRAGKSKVHLRGGAKRKPVATTERPGSGVRSMRGTPRDA